MDRDIIANIKSLAIDMINEAKCGHPGISLGAAPIIYTLYSKHLNINVNDINWLNRDRFVMSAGHGAALLYATLFMAGYDININDLKHFRQINSKTPGHPELNVTPGVDISTGPLGQGFASAVGIALGEKILEAKYQLPKNSREDDDKSLFDYKVYVLCSDGDLMEGISYEAASLAGNLKLNNLIVLYDSNDITLDGATSKTFSENVLARFESLGWSTQLVKDGNDINEIDKALSRAQGSTKPTIIEVKTTIGYGSALAGTNIVHGKTLEKDDIAKIKADLNIDSTPFYVSEVLKQKFTIDIFNRGNDKYKLWQENYKYYINEMLSGDETGLDFLFTKKLDLLKFDWNFDMNRSESTRVINHRILNKISENIGNFIGGSADLSCSTKTYIENGGDISENNYDLKNIFFGVREGAMGAILNGLALVNFRVFGSTFLAFADYLKPAIRMSAMMELPVIYIFTHDSIMVGEDGPTHQPVEQLAMLRSIPNLNVYRPADAFELLGCWNAILSSSKPSALILTRQEVPILMNSDPNMIDKGAYIVRKEVGRLYGIIIATGSEVHLAFKIADSIFEEYKADIRVVSMPSMNNFLNQSKQYQEEVLPNGYKKFVIEAGSSFGWHRFVYNDNYLFTIDTFGLSGKAVDVCKQFGLEFETIKNKIKKLL